MLNVINLRSASSEALEAEFVSLDEANDQSAQQGKTLRIQSHELFEDLPLDFQQYQQIALEFPVFADGRAFSLAQKLRQMAGYQGKLVAVGKPLPDQINFFARLGFDLVEMPEQRNAAALRQLEQFSVAYQPA